MSDWIWLPEQSYPEYQLTYFPDYALEGERDLKNNYCIAEFHREYRFPCRIERVELRISADVFYTLTINDGFVGKGPASAGGDFLCDAGDVLPQYADRYTLCPDSDLLVFDAQVRLLRERLPEYSKGHGGLMIEGSVFLSDGSQQDFSTDTSWICRVDRRYPESFRCDWDASPDPWINAVMVEDIWQAEDTILEPLTEEKILPVGPAELCVPGGETMSFSVELDKIYSAFVGAEIRGEVEVVIEIGEFPGQ